MSQVARKHSPDGLVVLAVNAWDEPKKKIARFVKEAKLQQRMLLDGSEVGDLYGVRAVPTLFWIDRKGVIRDTLGDARGFEALDKKTRRLMKRSS